MLSPPFRWVLLRSIGLALLLIVFGDRPPSPGCLAARQRRALGRRHAGTGVHTPLQYPALDPHVRRSALGLVVGAIFLMPAVTAFVGRLFADEIAAQVERTHYPADPPGSRCRSARADRRHQVRAAGAPGLSVRGAVPAGRGARRRDLLLRHRLPAGPANISCSPPCGFIRRPRPRRCARRTEARCSLAGLLIAAFVSIPIVNLATPLFGMAFMVHVHKRLHGTQRERIVDGC